MCQTSSTMTRESRDLCAIAVNKQFYILYFVTLRYHNYTIQVLMEKITVRNNIHVKMQLLYLSILKPGL